MHPHDFIPFFEETVTIEQYVELDEAVVTYYLEKWTKEDDAILSDLASRFINRDLLNIFHLMAQLLQYQNCKNCLKQVVLIQIIIL